MPKQKFSNVALFSLVASIVFTLIDWVIHVYTFDYLKVTSYKYNLLPFLSPQIAYSVGKFIGTFIMFIILLYAFSNSKFKPMVKYSLITLIIVSVLQVRYLLDPYYSVWWHVSVYLFHFLILFGVLAVAKLSVSDIAEKKVY